MARPNFNDRSWNEIDWDTWGPHFSIADRATSVRELQNGIGTRYMEVQDLLSQLPPHAGKAKALVAAWRHEVNGYGRTLVFAEASRILARLDNLHGQVTAQLQAARQAAKAARKLRHRDAGPGAHAAPGSEDADDFEGMRHSAATARLRSDDPRPGQDSAAWRWRQVQLAMARECDARVPDSAKPVAARQFRAAIQAEDGEAPQQFQSARALHDSVRIVVAGSTQFWTTGLPHLEQMGIARFAIYRRDGQSRRFDYVAGVQRPEDAAAAREAALRTSPPETG
jgi:hypothetical protein